jgi:hypothetical protein
MVTQLRRREGTAAIDVTIDSGEQGSDTMK